MADIDRDQSVMPFLSDVMLDLSGADQAAAIVENAEGEVRFLHSVMWAFARSFRFARRGPVPTAIEIGLSATCRKGPSV
jgi:hypothetical protein